MKELNWLPLTSASLAPEGMIEYEAYEFALGLTSQPRLDPPLLEWRSGQIRLLNQTFNKRRVRARLTGSG